MLAIFLWKLHSVYLQLIRFNEIIKFTYCEGSRNFLIIKYGSLVDLTVFPSIIFRAGKEKEREKKQEEELELWDAVNHLNQMSTFAV